MTNWIELELELESPKKIKSPGANYVYALIEFRTSIGWIFGWLHHLEYTMEPTSEKMQN